MDGNSARIFVSRPVPWESSKFKKYKQLLDELVQIKTTQKRAQQSTLSKVGELSENTTAPALEKEDMIGSSHQI